MLMTRRSQWEYKTSAPGNRRVILSYRELTFKGRHTLHCDGHVDVRRKTVWRSP